MKVEIRSMNIAEYLDYQDKMDELQAKVEAKEMTTRKFISEMALWIMENIYKIDAKASDMLPGEMFNVAQKTVALSEQAEEEAEKN